MGGRGAIHRRSVPFGQAIGLYLAALERFERMRRDAASAGWVAEADSHERLGDVYRSLGGPDKARRSWDRAVELYRTHDRYDGATKVGEKSVPGRLSGAAP